VDKLLDLCITVVYTYGMEVIKTPDWSALITEAIKVEGSLSKIFNRFYNYSYGNQLLLWSQDVEEPVATWLRWKQLGRTVKKGSKAKIIVKPTPVYKTNEKGEKKEEFIIFKPLKCVFTLSDTEGEELKKHIELPAWSVLAACSELIIGQEEFKRTNGNVQGYAHHHSFAINPIAEYPIETAIHEIAHIILGHTDKEIMDSKAIERDIREFQAEAVAYIIMNETEAIDGQDWDKKGARGYIQHWLNGKMPSNEEIRPIFRAVDIILKAGRYSNAKATTHTGQ
jgi:hypothetical protein